MRFRVGVLAAVAPLFAGLACGGFSSVDDANPQGDGGPDEAAPLLDGTVEIGSPTDASVGCPDGGFCDNFDVDEAGARWAAMSVSELATLTLEASGSHSPPFALRTTVSPGAPSVARYAYLERVLAPAPSWLRCSVFMRFSGAFDGGGAGFVDLFYLKARAEAEGVLYYYVAIGGPSANLTLREFRCSEGGCASPPQTPLFTAAPDRWFSIVLTTDFRTGTVVVDGDVRFDGPMANFTPTAASIVLGVNAPAGSAAADVSFDDLVCELR